FHRASYIYVRMVAVSTVRRLQVADRPLLERMYEGFRPHDAAFGLPPGDTLRRGLWLDQVLRGVNFVAFHDNEIVGHIFLMGEGETAEMAIFVHQDFRRQGVAAELFDAALAEARVLRLRSLWVLVGSDNHAVRAAMRSFGFRVSSEKGPEA